MSAMYSLIKGLILNELPYRLQFNASLIPNVQVGHFTLKYLESMHRNFFIYALGSHGLGCRLG